MTTQPPTQPPAQQTAQPPGTPPTDGGVPGRPREPKAIGPVAGGVLGACLLVLVAAGVAAVAFRLGGDRPGWGRAVGLAAAACLPGTIAAWLVTRWRGPEPGRALVASLAAITLRTLPPLAALAWLSTLPPRAAGPPDGGGPPSADAAGILVAFYLALLAADVLLHIIIDGTGRGRGH
jgi:hypothetical protein